MDSWMNVYNDKTIDSQKIYNDKTMASWILEWQNDRSFGGYIEILIKIVSWI